MAFVGLPLMYRNDVKMMTAIGLPCSPRVPDNAFARWKGRRWDVPQSSANAVMMNIIQSNYQNQGGIKSRCVLGLHRFVQHGIKDSSAEKKRVFGWCI